MKRIILGLSILAIAGATTFVACKKDEVKKETNVITTKFNSNARLNNVSIFEELTTSTTQAPIELNTFTAFLAKVRFSKINVTSKTSTSLNFSIETALNFSNGEPYTYNGRQYSLVKIENNFELSSLQLNFSLFYNSATNQLFYKSGSVLLNIEVENDVNNIPEAADIDISVYIGLMEMFTKGNVETTFTPSALPTSTYQGTGLGFWNSRKTAEARCGASHRAILAAHPGWWSPGVDISCVWDNHFCMCTADYFSY